METTSIFDQFPKSLQDFLTSKYDSILIRDVETETKAEVVFRSNWISHDNYDEQEIVFKYNEKFYRIFASRTGSYSSSYEFDIDVDIMTEVEEITVINKVWINSQYTDEMGVSQNNTKEPEIKYNLKSQVWGYCPSKDLVVFGTITAIDQRIEDVYNLSSPLNNPSYIITYFDYINDDGNDVYDYDREFTVVGKTKEEFILNLLLYIVSKLNSAKGLKVDNKTDNLVKETKQENEDVD